MSKLSLISEADDMLNSGKRLNDVFFICSKGCEDRSYTVIDKYLNIISPQNMIILDSRLKNESLTQTELDKYNAIDQLTQDIDAKTILTISVENSNIGCYLCDRIPDDCYRIGVDISSMNFWEFSDILYFLLKVKRCQHIDLFYTAPNLYRYENEDIACYRQPRDPVSVNYVSNYFSTRTTDCEILVSMIGFHKHISKMIMDKMEMAQYYSINGFPSFYPKAKDISQVNNTEFLVEIEASKRYSSDAINPFYTYNTLVDISKDSGEAFMNICPLGTKPMAIGACLYALRFPRTTRLIYPYEETIITKSDGVGRTYCYTISLDIIQ